MIKNILFDFGGVIINIDPVSLVMEMTALGVKDPMIIHEQLLTQNAYARLETNELSAAGFRQLIREFSGKPFTDEEIDHAWNTIIRDIPQHRIDLLERLKKNYRIFLLSNSNTIHYEHYNNYVKESFEYDSLDAIFERAWYSFRMGLYKPDLEIFHQVLKEGGLVAEETLFIDDNQSNVVAAEEVGMKGYHLKDGEDIVELFEDGVLKI